MIQAFLIPGYAERCPDCNQFVGGATPADVKRVLAVHRKDGGVCQMQKQERTLLAMQGRLWRANA